MPEQQPLEAKIVGRIVEAGLSSQVEAAEQLEATVETDLGQAMQGQAEGVSVVGRDVEVKPGVNVKALQVETDHLALNPLSLLLGQVQLTEPVDTHLRLTLTEDDLTRALNSPTVLQQPLSLKLEVEGQPIIMSLVPPMSVQLPGKRRLGFKGHARLEAPGDVRTLEMKMTVIPRYREQPFWLEEFRCGIGEGLSPEVAIALIEKFRLLANAYDFAYQGMTFRVTELDVQPGFVTLSAAAHIEQLPQG